MKVILWIATGVAVVFATDGCATAARLAVEWVEGVREARFAYAAGEGLVTFDTTMTSVPEIVAQLERMTDFSATERPGGGG